MKRFYLKLLITSVLLSAITCNSSYSMEDNTNAFEGKTLQNELDKNISFEEIFNDYQNAKILKEKQNQIEIFYKYLFGNKFNNLKSILDCGTKKEWISIVNMLKENHVQKTCITSLKDVLLKDSKSFQNIVNIVNNTKPNDNDAQKIINYIKLYIYRAILGKAISFKSLYDKYCKAKHNNDIIDQTKQIETFCKYLFGNNGNNLETILSLNVRPEVKYISYMLFENDTQKYLINFLNNKENKLLLESLSCIVKLINDNNNCDVIRKITDIKSCISEVVISTQLLDIDIPIQEILDKYTHNEANTEPKDRYIFEIINCINNCINTVKLMKLFGMDISFMEIYDKYKDAQNNNNIEIQTKLSKNFCNYLFGTNNGDNLKTVLSYNIEDEIECISLMLDTNDVKKHLVYLLNKDKSLLVKLPNIVSSIEPINFRFHSIVDNINCAILMQKLWMEDSFEEIYNTYGNAKYYDHDFTTSQEQCEKFCKYLFENNNGDNLKTVFDFDIEDEINAISNMLKQDDVKTHLIDLLVKNDALYKNLLPIVQRNNEDNNDIVTTKNQIKNYIELAEPKRLERKKEEIKTKLPEINDLCNNIIKNSNNINRNEDIDKLLDYLLDEDLITLECILEYCNNETLELIARVLQNSEVQKNLRITRVKFIQRLIEEYGKDEYKYKMVLLLTKIINDNSMNYDLKNNRNEAIDDIMNNCLQLHQYNIFEQKCSCYKTDLQTVIKECREKIMNVYKGNETAKAVAIIDSLVHEDLEGYAEDILFAYEGYQMLNELFKDHGKFTHDISDYTDKSKLQNDISKFKLKYKTIFQNKLNKIKNNQNNKKQSDCVNVPEQDGKNEQNKINETKEHSNVININKPVKKNAQIEGIDNADNFTFENLKNVVQGNGTKEQIEKINRLFSRQLVQYYINNEVDGSKIKECVKKLDEIENKMYSDTIDGNENSNRINVLNIVKQCFREREAFIKKQLEKINKQGEEKEKKKEEFMNNNNNNINNDNINNNSNI